MGSLRRGRLARVRKRALNTEVMVEIAFDTSPLAQTRAGTARYIRGLLGELERTPDVALERHSFALGGRAAVPVRDLGWYLGALPLFRAHGGRSPLPDVSRARPLACAAGRHLPRPGHLRHPETFNTWTRSVQPFLCPRVAHAAARVIAVSEFTAGELVDLLGVPETKIRVIPNAVGPPFTAAGDAAEGDYVLAVSTLEPRKNLGRLVEGFRRADLNGCELRIVGARGWGDVEPVQGDGVRWLGEVSDDELARLYRGARCAAYVSRYEGFGLPVLEAMACGTPVVTADLPPIREFAAASSRSIHATQMRSRPGSARRPPRRRAGHEGPEAAAAYDWGRVARETIGVYREVMR